MKGNRISHRYDDIIELEHHVSVTRPRMPVSDRAAQFSPFAALTGYDAAILESGRLTDARVELDESKKQALDEKLRMLLARREREAEVTIRYFQPDERKAGGAYISVTGRVKKLDAYGENLILEDQTRIPIGQICELDSALFDPFDGI